MDTPKVSVTMPVGGPAAEYADRAIESVYRQTFDDWELLIQPASGCTGHIRTGADDRITVLAETEDAVAAARNRCLDAASGEYIAVLDSDDEATPHWLDSQVTFLENNPEVDLAGQSESTVRIIGEAEIVQEYGQYPPVTLTRAWDGSVIQHSGTVFRNDDWRYRDKFTLCEEFDLYLRIADGDLSNVVARDADLVTSHVTDGSLTDGEEQASKEQAIVAASFYSERQDAGEDSYDEWGPGTSNDERVRSYLDSITG